MRRRRMVRASKAFILRIKDALVIVFYPIAMRQLVKKLENDVMRT